MREPGRVHGAQGYSDRCQQGHDLARRESRVFDQILGERPPGEPFQNQTDAAIAHLRDVKQTHESRRGGGCQHGDVEFDARRFDGGVEDLESNDAPGTGMSEVHHGAGSSSQQTDYAVPGNDTLHMHRCPSACILVGVAVGGLLS